MNSKITINKLTFTKKALKRFNNEKDKIREKEILEELSYLIINGLNNSFQKRTINKYKKFNLIDYLEHHKKQRIIIYVKNKTEIQIIDVLFDHLGRDKLDYKRYWEGSENINFEQKLILKEEQLIKIFIDKNYEEFFKLI